MRIYIGALVLALTTSLVLADVKFTAPAAGAILKGGGALSIAWQESNIAPLISTLASYQLFLMAGGNEASNQVQLATLVIDGSFTAAYVAEGVVTASLGGSTKNAYFLKMISVAKEGGTLINYSSRFTLTGMTGVFPAGAVQQAINAIGSSTAGPPTQNNVNTGAAAGAAGGEYTVPYTLQTGLTKYAPMQSMPPTKISAKKVTPLFPTSAFELARTFLPPPQIVTTLTQSNTFSVASRENTAAAQSMPTDDMAKFLRRWVD